MALKQVGKLENFEIQNLNKFIIKDKRGNILADGLIRLSKKSEYF